MNGTHPQASFTPLPPAYLILQLLLPILSRDLLVNALLVNLLHTTCGVC